MLCFAVGAGAMVLAPKIASVTGISALVAFRLIRFFTGIGEAAVSSNVTRVIASWTSVRERGFASGLQVCGLGLGGTLTPVFIAWTMLHLGWQVSFLSCAVLAFLVVAVWNWYATDWPEHHRGVNPAEFQRIRPGSLPGEVPLAFLPPKGRVLWWKMLTSISVWGLILGYGFQGYAFYVYYNWFYFYAVKSRGLPLMQAAAWTSAPFIAMALLSPVGGWISDRVSHRIGRRYGRIVTVWIGMGTAGLLLFSGSHVKISAMALPMIALAAGFTMFAAASFWAACIDLAPGFSASLSALMNTVGSVGGAISSTVTASIVVHQGWSKALDTAAWITVASAMWFSAVNAERAIEERSN